jgi:hypothetical protein
MTITAPRPVKHPLSAMARDDYAAAGAYNALAHRPESFAVKLTYLHFEAETLAQWGDILADGLTVEFHDGVHNYASSHDMINDVTNNRHLYTYRTNTETDQIPADHPMLRSVAGTDLLLNDVFRAVHDVNGHVATGGSFALSGERTAWEHHRNMYSRDALAALWCETRGQSAWTNRWADHETLPLRYRPFAPQKAGIPSNLFV